MLSLLVLSVLVDRWSMVPSHLEVNDLALLDQILLCYSNALLLGLERIEPIVLPRRPLI